MAKFSPLNLHAREIKPKSESVNSEIKTLEVGCSGLGYVSGFCY